MQYKVVAVKQQGIEALAERVRMGGYKFVKFVFSDNDGQAQCRRVPAKWATLDHLKEGIGFDSSSHRLELGRTVDSDLALRPIANFGTENPFTTFDDLFSRDKTLNVVVEVCDPKTGLPHRSDPREVVVRAEKSLEKLIGTGAVAIVGTESEGFVFNKVEAHLGHYGSMSKITSNEFSDAAEPESRKPVMKPNGGYTPAGPEDSTSEWRAKTVSYLEILGFEMELDHHEVAAGQFEFGVRCSKMLQNADGLLEFRLVVKQSAAEEDLEALFMPKPITGQNGSGMHVHISFQRCGINLFAGEDGELSKMGQMAMAGLMKYGREIAAFTNSTVNSYLRLVPGFEAPTRLAWGHANRSAALRIPNVPDHSPGAIRFEYRAPDGAGSPHLALAAIQMAMLAGIREELKLPKSVDGINLFHEDAPYHIDELPGSLGSALDILEANHAFLLEDGVFTEDFIKHYIAMKREEVRVVDKGSVPPSHLYYYRNR